MNVEAVNIDATFVTKAILKFHFYLLHYFFHYFRESGTGPQIIVPKPIGVKASEPKAERESQITEVEIVHVEDEKVEIVAATVEEKVEVSSSTVDTEKGKSNEEVLSKLVDEAENDEDRFQIHFFRRQLFQKDRTFYH